MKIQVYFIVYDSNNCPTKGRTCWINRNENGELLFGSIYLTKETAPNLTTEEIKLIMSLAGKGHFNIEKIHED